MGGVANNKGKAIVRKIKKGKGFHCHGEGHWKRNCPRLLESLKRQRERASKEKVGLSLSYMLPNVLRAHLKHQYWIPMLVLTFFHP